LFGISDRCCQSGRLYAPLIGEYWRSEPVKEVQVMADHSINGKTVLIAGGAKNLGGLLARDLAEQGAKAVVIHYNRDADKAQADETLAAIKAAALKPMHFRATSPPPPQWRNCSPTRRPRLARSTSPSTLSARC
jgi:hypothetical protein